MSQKKIRAADINATGTPDATTALFGDNSWKEIDGGSTIFKVCGEDFSASTVVILWTDDLLYKFDITNILHYGKCLGVTKVSGLTGENVEVVTFPNEHIDVGSGWMTGTSYWVSATGMLTTFPPSSGICKNVAIGIGTDRVKLKDAVETVLL